MKNHLALILLGLIGLLSSCGTTEQPLLTSTEKKEIEDTIKFLGLIVEKAVNGHDLQMSFDLMSDDPDFTFSEDGYIKPEKSKSWDIMKPVYDKLPAMTLSYDKIRVVALDKYSGVFTGEGPWSATDMQGNVMKGHLVSMFVFVNRNNKWQMIHGHTSHTFEKK
jgi:hypothetical protein